MTKRSVAVWGMLGAWGLFAAACSTTIVDGACPEGAHCVPEDACNAGQPSDGDPCTVIGKVCTYPYASDCQSSEMVATCGASSTWQLSNHSEGCCDDLCGCGPCVGACPPTIPAAGDPCMPGINAACDYTVSTSCGDQSVTATCIGNLWDVPAVTCVPDAACKMYGNQQDCTADPTCRWLEPGCGQPAAPEGCYAMVECDATHACASGQACLEMSADPCWGLDCGNCSETVHVCRWITE